jgi:Fe-S cluster biogenesis protein NfuA
LHRSPAGRHAAARRQDATNRPTVARIEMPAERDLRSAADRIEALLAELAALGDPLARAKAQDLVRLLMSLYGGGLERILEIVWEEGGAAADRCFERLADDALVSSLLVLHGLHPLDLPTRLERALDGVRPYLASHGGAVTLLGVEEGRVRLRLEGSCHGCPSSAVTMKTAIERALCDAAPEIAGIDLEGVEGEAPGLIQIGSAASA